MQLENVTLNRCNYNSLKEEWNIGLTVPDFDSIDYTEVGALADWEDLVVTIKPAQLHLFEKDRVGAGAEEV